ncbi:MAG: nucleotide exchange factor GrpE [Alphaproteobacteria bacterium]|nr:nucleotide exchange factor GrpE [Alphaproteobacteria bacterium]
MNDTEMKQPAPGPGEPANADAPPAESVPSTALERELADREREVAETKDRLLRTLAEMENLRRRTEREVADARAYGVTAFARDMLGVADNMHRALNAFDAEARQQADDGVKALLDGVELTERELANALEKHGVRRIEAQGQKFDPNRHQAMYEAEDPTVPAGTVVQVVQAGYSIGERVLRPALVAVAKGGPKAPSEAAGNGGPGAAGESK